MALIAVHANLQLVAPGGPFNAVFVRLVSDLDGSVYTSAAASDSLGNFTVAGVPLGPQYQIQTAPASVGPWTGQNQGFQPGQNPIGTVAVSLTPAALAASIGFSEQTFTVNGLQVGDIVLVVPPAAPAALADMTRARVSALNTLALTFFNATAAANVPIAGTYLVSVIRT